MRYAVSKGAFIAVAGGNDYEDGNPVERLAEQAAPSPAPWRSLPSAPMAIGPVFGVQSYIEIARPEATARLVERRRVAADLTTRRRSRRTICRRRSTGHLASTLREHQLHGDVDGNPARRRPGRAPDVAGHHDPSAVEAAIKQFATDKGPRAETTSTAKGSSTRGNASRLGIIR